MGGQKPQKWLEVILPKKVAKSLCPHSSPHSRFCGPASVRRGKKNENIEEKKDRPLATLCPADECLRVVDLFAIKRVDDITKTLLPNVNDARVPGGQSDYITQLHVIRDDAIIEVLLRVVFRWEMFFLQCQQI